MCGVCIVTTESVMTQSAGVAGAAAVATVAYHQAKDRLRWRRNRGHGENTGDHTDRNAGELAGVGVPETSVGRRPPPGGA